jgi:two-component system cell cycle sensor histidine kinase PleC
VEQNRYLGIGTMTALLEKTVDLAHRRAIELEEAHRNAEIASEAKSRFLAAMSHKLRTPLNAIIGFAELLLMRDVERMEQDRCRGYITDIRNSGAHLLALINDILDYSKLEAVTCSSPRRSSTLASSSMTACAWRAPRPRSAA